MPTAQLWVVLAQHVAYPGNWNHVGNLRQDAEPTTAAMLALMVEQAVRDTERTLRRAKLPGAMIASGHAKRIANMTLACRVYSFRAVREEVFEARNAAFLASLAATV